MEAALDVMKEVIELKALPPTCIFEVMVTLCQYCSRIGMIVSHDLTLHRAACVATFNKKATRLASILINTSPAAALLCYRFARCAVKVA